MTSTYLRAAGYMMVNLEDIVRLNWLPINEKVDLTIAKYAHRTQMVLYILVNIVHHDRRQRSNDSGPMIFFSLDNLVLDT